jgi:lysophospholipase
VNSQFVEQPGRPRIPFRIERPPNGSVPKGSVLITTGFGEHTGRYEEVLSAFTGQGFVVAAHDLRGQGKSEGVAGHIDSFDDYLTDTRLVLDELSRDAQWQSALKPVLFAHSYGCLISAHLALRSPGAFRALAWSSPYFGRALRTPAWKVWMGRGFSRFWPKFSQPTGISGKLVTHDPKLRKDSDEDPLRIERVTARWFTESEAAEELLLEEAHRLTLPIYCQAAGDDLIASLERTRAILIRAASSDKELVVRDGEYHELHREMKRADYIQAFVDKLNVWALAVE